MRLDSLVGVLSFGFCRHCLRVLQVYSKLGDTGICGYNQITGWQRIDYRNCIAACSLIYEWISILGINNIVFETLKKYSLYCYYLPDSFFTLIYILMNFLKM